MFTAGENNAGFLTTKKHRSLRLTSHGKLNLPISLRNSVFSFTTSLNRQITQGGFCFLMPHQPTCECCAPCKPTFDCCVVSFDIFKQPDSIHLGRENTFSKVQQQGHHGRSEPAAVTHFLNDRRLNHRSSIPKPSSAPDSKSLHSLNPVKGGVMSVVK